MRPAGRWDSCRRSIERYAATASSITVSTFSCFGAELGAAFLCADLGLEPEVREDHAGYIENWLKVLKADKRATFTAASKASEAATWLLAKAGQGAA